MDSTESMPHLLQKICREYTVLYTIHFALRVYSNDCASLLTSCHTYSQRSCHMCTVYHSIFVFKRSHTTQPLIFPISITKIQHSELNFECEEGKKNHRHCHRMNEWDNHFEWNDVIFHMKRIFWLTCSIHAKWQNTFGYQSKLAPYNPKW